MSEVNIDDRSDERLFSWHDMSDYGCSRVYKLCLPWFRLYLKVPHVIFRDRELFGFVVRRR